MDIIRCSNRRYEGNAVIVVDADDGTKYEHKSLAASLTLHYWVHAVNSRWDGDGGLQLRLGYDEIHAHAGPGAEEPEGRARSAVILRGT